jgi:hypothetical protein
MSWGCVGMIVIVLVALGIFAYQTLWGKGVAWPGER